MINETPLKVVLRGYNNSDTVKTYTYPERLSDCRVSKDRSFTSFSLIGNVDNNKKVSWLQVEVLCRMEKL